MDGKKEFWKNSCLILNKGMLLWFLVIRVEKTLGIYQRGQRDVIERCLKNFVKCAIINNISIVEVRSKDGILNCLQGYHLVTGCSFLINIEWKIEKVWGELGLQPGFNSMSPHNRNKWKFPKKSAIKLVRSLK